MGMLDEARPIIGYIVVISIIILLGSLAFFAPASATMVESAQTMSEVLILVALLIGVGMASRATKNS